MDKDHSREEPLRGNSADSAGTSGPDRTASDCGFGQRTARVGWRKRMIAGGVLLGFALAAAAALWLIHAARYRPGPQELIVLGQADLFTDSTAAFRVLVRNHDRGGAIPGAQVRMAIQGQSVRRDLGTFVTGPEGTLSDAVHIPPIDPGEYELVVEANSEVGRDRITHPIWVQKTHRMYLTTDKPIYQPSQTIHVRAMVLDLMSLKPAADQPILFEISDAKANNVFKADVTASKYGIASCDFALAGEVNLGDYRIRATAGGVHTDKTVQVQRYVLPPFKVDAATDKAHYLPSEQVKGLVQARYSFGKPVVDAQVEVVGRVLVYEPAEVFRLGGTTDADGRFVFQADLARYFTTRPLEGEAVSFEIKVVVKDHAGHEEAAIKSLRIIQQSIAIHMFPESGHLVRGVENIIYIITTYPDGRPAVCEVDINGTVQRSDATGIVVFKTKDVDRLTLDIHARDDAGRTGALNEEIRQGDDLLLRTDKAVYRAGETVHATISCRVYHSEFFLDVLRNGQAVLTKTAPTNDDGRAEISLDLPADLYGSLEFVAYTIGRYNDMSDSDSRVVYVRPAEQLRIETSWDKPAYEPGETASLRLAVTDLAGTPVPAALSLAAVDEAVFYVCDSRPGSTAEFFLTDEDLPLAGYEAAFVVSPAKLLGGEDEYQNLARALFSREGLEAGWREQLWKPSDRLPAEFMDIYIPDPHTLHAESYSEKTDEARAWRHRYYRIPLAIAALVFMPIPPLIALVLLAHTLFRAFRRTVADDSRAGEAPVQRAAARFVNISAFLVLLPTVTYFTAFILGALPGGSGVSHSLNRYFEVSFFILGVLLVALATLSVAAFPFIWRFRAASWREIRKSALGGLALSVLSVVLVFAVQCPATGGMIQFVASKDTHVSHAFLVSALPWLLSMALCAGAYVTSRKAPGRFYRGLGRSGQIVLAAAIVQALILLTWVSLPVLEKQTWAIRRSPRRASARRVWHRPDRRPVLSSGMMGGMGGYGGGIMSQEDDVAADERALIAPRRVRELFPETLLWRPQLITDDAGRASLDVPLADSITTWKMNVDAVSSAGKLGSSAVDLRAFQDFFVDLDLPIALTRGDEISIPVRCYNYLSSAQTVRLTLEPGSWCTVQGPAVQQAELAPNDVRSILFRIKAAEVGRHELVVRAQGSSLGDAVRRSVDVRPDGVEVQDLQSGALSRSAEHTFTIPPDSVPNSPRLSLMLYPSKFSEVLEGLDSLFRMPYGCFEQTSSVTYPNVMVLQYVKQTGQIPAGMETRAREYIAAGYQRLLTFEVKGGGFDWFGQTPAKARLTAYGILQLMDMAKVHPVDPNVISRATQWLLSQRDPDGAWSDSDRTPGGNDDARSRVGDTAYIAWALAEAGVKGADLDDSLVFLRGNVRETDSPYLRALAANALLASDPGDGVGQRLATGLQSAFELVGNCAWIRSAGIGALHSRGSCFDVESTSLAVLALIKVNPYAELVPKAFRWLCEQKDQHGIWRSTQATVLAMKALVAGTSKAQSGGTSSRIEIAINDQPAGSVEITPLRRDLLQSLDLSAHLKPGRNTVRLTQEQGTELPYRLAGSYWSPHAASTTPAASELSIRVNYDRDHLSPGEVLTCRVQVAHSGAGPLNMAIIGLGVPPGFTVDRSAFEHLVESGVIARYEMAGDQPVLYVRSVLPGAELRFDYALKALHPVRAQIPASYAYEYYQPENRHQTEPVEIVVE